MTELQVQQAILLALGQDARLRLWRANTGVAFTPQGRAVRFGVTGQADLSGILAGGRRLEIEVKSATGRQSPEQKAFQSMIERFGGLYVLAHDLEDVLCRL